MKKQYNKPSIAAAMADLRTNMLKPSVDASENEADDSTVFGKEREEDDDATDTAWDTGSLW